MALAAGVFKDWKAGKSDATAALQHAEGCAATAAIVRSVLHAAVSGLLSPDEAALFLADEETVAASGMALEELQLLVCDVIHLLDLELQHGRSAGSADAKAQRTSLVKLVMKVRSKSAASESLLRERLDGALLVDASLVNPDFEKSIVQSRTKMFYKQQKYNLMHEETEGFAKLAAELNQDHAAAGSRPADLLRNMQDLIGYFEIDPNRVLDVVLDAFEVQPQQEAFFLPLLQEVAKGGNASALPNLLGNKFQRYTKAASAAPESLLHLAGLLITRRAISVADLYPHLGPSDEAIREEEAEALSLVVKRAGKVRISLKLSAEEQKEEAKKKAGQAADKLKRNQKLGVASALLNLADFPNARKIMDRLPEAFAASYEPLRRRLLHLAHGLLEPVYRKKVAPKVARAGALVTKFLQRQPGLQLCEELSELPERVFPLLHAAGFYLSSDVMLFTKVLRVCGCVLKTSSELKQSPLALQDEIEALFERVLLPALTLVPQNPALSEAVWGAIQHLPYETRYSLYGYWKNETPKQHAPVMRARARVLQESKRVLTRLTKENVRLFGRKIGKLSHSFPGPLFDDIFSKIQMFDNLIAPIIDSLKYLTRLAYDVLSYCLVEALSNPARQRLKSEDTNISQWLRNLAMFTGQAYKKYPLNLAGVLQYVTNRLKTNETFDMLILKELIINMSGMEHVEDVTAEQLQAQNGGPTLHSEAGSFLNAKANKEKKKATVRLRDTLVNRRLAVPLLVLIARLRNTIIFQAGNSQHLKLTALLCDQCSLTFVQLQAFLERHLAAEDYDKMLPSIKTLCGDYHLQADAAYFLTRSRQRRSISQRISELGDKGKGVPGYIEAANSVMTEAMDATKVLYAEETWQHITLSLYVAFWSHTLYDLEVPNDAYAAAISKVKAAQSENSKDKSLSTSRRKKEHDRLQEVSGKLEKEQRDQAQNRRLVRAWMKSENGSWITEADRKTEMITQFMQICIVPRCMFSALDATFCARFTQLMHKMRTENWPTLLYLDRVLKNVVVPISSCTENEARRYGRYLSETFELVGHWHSDKSVFDAECANTPGFKTQLRRGDGKEGGMESGYVQYEDYRDAAYVWHRRVTKSFVFLLSSNDYVLQRNSVLILTKLLPHYPKLRRFSAALTQRIEAVCEEAEKKDMEDLKIMARTYLAKLKLHKAELVSDDEYHNGSKSQAKKDAGKDQAAGGAASDAKDAKGAKDGKEAPPADATAAAPSGAKANGKAARENGSAQGAAKGDAKPGGKNGGSGKGKAKGKDDGRSGDKQAKEKGNDDGKASKSDGKGGTKNGAVKPESKPMPKLTPKDATSSGKGGKAGGGSQRSAPPLRAAGGGGQKSTGDSRGGDGKAKAQGRQAARHDSKSDSRPGSRATGRSDDPGTKAGDSKDRKRGRSPINFGSSGKRRHEGDKSDRDPKAPSRSGNFKDTGKLRQEPEDKDSKRSRGGEGGLSTRRGGGSTERRGGGGPKDQGYRRR